MKLQLESLFDEFDALHNAFGDPDLYPIYGAGNIVDASLMLIFMNPTGRNVSSKPGWTGIRAPWLGTKHVWKLLFETGIIDKQYFEKIQSMKPEEWSLDFAVKLYEQVAGNGAYITNFAKCTLPDARPLNDSVFRKYKRLLEKEIAGINPANIVTFGNQVSSNLLSKNISVSKYRGLDFEEISVKGSVFKVYPSYYPVGQGQRNMPLAKQRLNSIINQ
jgi:DNA polymerase